MWKKVSQGTPPPPNGGPPPLKGRLFVQAPSWIGLLFQGRLFHRHLSLSPKQFPAPENISENFVKTIAIPNEMWYNKFCEPLHKACAAFPCIPSRLSRRLLCQKFSAYTPLCRACAHDIRQYHTKSVWRLCTPSACKFPVIFHKNAREYIQYSLRFLFHLTKNLTTHLSHNLCAVLP